MALLLLFGTLFLLAGVLQAQTVTFDDPNLENAVRQALGIGPTDPLTLADVQTLTSLSAGFAGIQTLGGIESLSNLTFLFLSFNRINDITPLAVLTQLTDLRLDSNSISDITPLAGLTQLTSLDLTFNLVSDLTPLSGLAQLSNLQLSSNTIGDLTPLAGLTQLTDLFVGDNAISDLTPLSGLTQLIELDLGGNTISDLTQLAGLTQLTDLFLSDNAISDLTPLAGLTQLTHLSLGDNSISDLTPLAGLTQLARLFLRGNAISDLTPLAGLTQLIELDLRRNTIVDLTPLAGLAQLKDLELTSNSISDLLPLAGLTQLTRLDLRRNTIVDLTPLSGLTQLTSLRLSANPISDFTPLAGLTQLKTLEMESNSISDITPLAGLTQLTQLELSSNSISDLTPLAGLTLLDFLFLDSNSISDITALVSNPGLGPPDPMFGGGDFIVLTSNALGLDDCPDLQTLIDRGAFVEHDMNCGAASFATFAGNVDNSFTNPNNWDTGVVPGLAEAVEIPSDSGDVIIDESVVLASIVVNPGSTLRLTAAATLTLNEGPSHIASGATVEIEGALVVGALPEPPSSVGLASQHLGGTSVTNSGTVTEKGGTITIGSGASWVNANNGTLNLLATIDGSPVLLVSNGGTFTNNGTVNWSGGTIEMQGARLENREGGIFSGFGVILGDVQNEGEFHVGSSVGSITVTGNYEQTSSGSLNTELGGTDTSEFDVLTVGSSTLDGTLNVSLIDGFSGNAGDGFAIVVGPSTGSFENTNLPGLTAGLKWDVLYGSVTLVISGTASSDKTILIANFLNGNNQALNSRVYLFNSSASAGDVTVRVFTLPPIGGIAQELTVSPLALGNLGADSAMNIKLAEDILTPLGIPLPYTDNGGDLTLEFTIGAANVRGATQVFSPTLAFGTNPLQEIPSTSSGGPTVLVASFMNGNDAAFDSRAYLFNPSASAGDVTVRVFTLPLEGGTAQELTGTPLDVGTLGAKSALSIRVTEDVLTPLGITGPYVTDGGNLTLEFTIGAADVKGAAQVFSSEFAFGVYPMQEISSTSSGSPTVLVANFMNGNNAVLNSRVYLWNPSSSDGDVTVRVFTLPLNSSTAQELTTTPLSLGTLAGKSARNVKLAEDILAPLGITTPYITDGGNLTLEFTIQAADVGGTAQVFSSSFAFGTNPLQAVPSISAGSPTVLVANFMNGNNGVLNSRIYLWNPSQTAGSVTARVFTLPLIGGLAQELTETPLNLRTLGARSALNIKLAEDVLTPLGIALPYTTNGGNLTVELTIQAPDVRGAAQVFSSSFAFGTYPIQ